MINDGFIIFKGGSGYQQAPFFRVFGFFSGFSFLFGDLRIFLEFILGFFLKINKGKKGSIQENFQ